MTDSKNSLTVNIKVCGTSTNGFACDNIYWPLHKCGNHKSIDCLIMGIARGFRRLPKEMLTPCRPA